MLLLLLRRSRRPQNCASRCARILVASPRIFLAREDHGMSYSQWQNACHSAANATIDDVLLRFSTSYSSVSFVCIAVVVVSFALSILYFRLPLERRSMMWGQYGWFVGSVCASSLMSSLAWGSANGFAGYAFKFAANVNT